MVVVPSFDFISGVAGGRPDNDGYVMPSLPKRGTVVRHGVVTVAATHSKIIVRVCIL